MKTKILFTFLLVASFCFASEMQAQHVLKFTNKNEGRTEARGKLDIKNEVTVTFMLNAGGSSSSPYRVRFGLWNYSYELNSGERKYVTITLPAGLREFYVGVTNSQPNQYYYPSIEIYRVESGNAVISTVWGEASLGTR